MPRTSLLTMLLPTILLAACGGDDKPPAAGPVAYASRCGLPDDAAEPYRTATPTGPHCVGATEHFVTDDARDETLTADAHDRRSVHVRMLYPAGGPGRVRLPYAIEEMFGELKWWPAALRPQGHAWLDAPPAIEGRAPVLLFSPGLGAPAQAYAGLTEELASHGYVVAVISHPYISGATPLPGGRIARYTDDDNDEPPVLDGGGQEGSEMDEQAMAAALAEEKRYFDALIGVTVADERMVLDWLAARHAAPDDALSGRLDLHRVGALGHSFGGATAMQVQRTDARVKAAVNVDGTIRGDLDKPWTKPFMILQSEYIVDGRLIEDDTVTAVWTMRQGPGERAAMAATCHGDFGDAARLVKLFNTRNPAAPVELDKTLFCNKDPEALEAQVRGKVLDFFGRYLRGG